MLFHYLAEFYIQYICAYVPFMNCHFLKNIFTHLTTGTVPSRAVFSNRSAYFPLAIPFSFFPRLYFPHSREIYLSTRFPPSSLRRNQSVNGGSIINEEENSITLETTLEYFHSSVQKRRSRIQNFRERRVEYKMLILFKLLKYFKMFDIASIMSTFCLLARTL